MRETVKAILKKIHLYGLAKAALDVLRQFRRRCGSKRRRNAFQREFENFFEQVKRLEPSPGGIVVAGLLCTPHKPTLMTFLSQIQQCLPQRQIILLDERTEPAPSCPFPRLCIPRSAPLHYDRQLELPCDPNMEQLLREKAFLQNAVSNLLGRHQDMTNSYAKMLVCATYYLYREIAIKWKSNCAFIWNEFSALHTLCAQAFREQGIPCFFLEFGVLPGTFALDCAGQMGRSAVAVQYNKFLQLPVQEAEITQAGKVLEYLKQSGLNRNVQPLSGDELLLSRLKRGRPIVLFTGQNDFDSGIVPYTQESVAYHSPSFGTSLEAAESLAVLAEKNDWNFIFKPHPGMVQQYDSVSLRQNVIYISSFDLNKLIDMSDVVVTITSQTAYVALIRGRPAVLLGYNQLKGKGCSYEAFSLEEMESKIQEALCLGQTRAQREMFLRHTAQLLKYSLFDDLASRSLRYGRQFDLAILGAETTSALIKGLEGWSQ